MKLEEAVIKCKEFYGDNPPKTVSEYMSNFPKGLGRTTLKRKFNLTGGQFLELIGSSYKAMESTEDKFISKCTELGLKPLSSTVGLLKNTKVTVSCSKCTDEFTTYWDTLSQCLLGCQQCAGMKRLSLRKPFLDSKAAGVNAKVVTLPLNNTDKMTLECVNCTTRYSVRASALTNPQSDKQATCPNCRSSDTRVAFEGITFGSQFERECYKLLKHLKPKLQQLYKHEFSTDRLWACDFVVGDSWIEVSSYTKNSQGYASYISNIAAKEEVVVTAGKSFYYLTSLREVQDFVDNI